MANQLAETVARMLFGMSTSDAKEKKICIQCKKKKSSFWKGIKKLERQEYGISALCPSCYNKSLSDDPMEQAFPMVSHGDDE